MLDTHNNLNLEMGVVYEFTAPATISFQNGSPYDVWVSQTEGNPNPIIIPHMWGFSFRSGEVWYLQSPNGNATLATFEV